MGGMSHGQMLFHFIKLNWINQFPGCLLDSEKGYRITWRRAMESRSLVLKFFGFVLAGLLLFLVIWFVWSVPVTPVHAAADVTVYADSLASGWANWSWGAAVNLSNASPVHAGSASTAVTINSTEWGGLYLHTDAALEGSNYTGVRFWIHGGVSGGQQIEFKIIDGGNGNWNPSVSLSPATNTWTQVTVQLSQVSNPSSIGGLVWQDATGGSQPTFYVDDIVLLGYNGPTPVPSPTSPPGQGPILSVDAAADVHAISPYIYGMNFADEDLADELGLPVNRRGGNSTTRYNWQTDVHNTGSDWFYENIPGPNAYDSSLPDGSGADLFFDQNNRTGTDTIMTIPLIGWTPKAGSASHPYDCGFKVSEYGAQDSVDPWDTDCGNGLHNGVEIAGNDPLDTSFAIGPSFVTDWITHLTGKYGTAANGGVLFYNLDNEPMLWNSTHRDVHPNGTTYDELRDQTYTYAAAIKAADPGAKTLGPVVWGWCAYFYSGADGCGPGSDRAAHGNMDFIPWYLQQMNLYEQQNGVRILDYLDMHSYPYASGVSLSDAGNAATQALRLRSTRSLWDPTYLDESWVGTDLGQAVYTIPRMKQWVAQNYPGTKTAITEYNWGGHEHINGALAQSDVLGIFGREGLDLATLWGPPSADQPAAYAFRMYLNYDGNGSGFGETSVKATSADQGKLAIYAAKRTGDKALTLIIINKTGGALTSQIALSNFGPMPVAQVYRYSGANLNAIVHQADQAVSSSGFSATFPANSITLMILFPLNQPDISPSYKTTHLPAASYGDTLTYTIHIINQGIALTQTVFLTDTVPAGLAYVPGSLTAAVGAVDDSSAPSLYWSGMLPTAQTVSVSYAVTVTATLPQPITNTAWISYGDQPLLSRSRMIIVNGQLVYLPLIRR